MVLRLHQFNFFVVFHFKVLCQFVYFNPMGKQALSNALTIPKIIKPCLLMRSLGDFKTFSVSFILVIYFLEICNN